MICWNKTNNTSFQKELKIYKNKSHKFLGFKLDQNINWKVLVN